MSKIPGLITEYVEDGTVSMSIANAEQVEAALIRSAQWKRDWFGRKSLVLGGSKFHVSPRREVGSTGSE